MKSPIKNMAYWKAKNTPAKQKKEEEAKEVPPNINTTFTPRRETSWWKGEEGFIPDEWQGIKRPKVKVKGVKAVNLGTSR